MIKNSGPTLIKGNKSELKLRSGRNLVVKGQTASVEREPTRISVEMQRQTSYRDLESSGLCTENMSEGGLPSVGKHTVYHSRAQNSAIRLIKS